MKARLAGLGAALLGCAATIVSSAAVASADPPDPHQPELTHNYCPGGQWGFGVQVCDGEKYLDGSYWHQWMQSDGYGWSAFHYDCVGDSGNNVFPTTAARWLQRGNSTRAAWPSPNLTATASGHFVSDHATGIQYPEKDRGLRPRSAAGLVPGLWVDAVGTRAVWTRTSSEQSD